MLKSKLAQGIQLTTPITIIGAGTIGLFTAYDLMKRGFTDITIVSEKFDKLTSHNAGGLLELVSMDNVQRYQKLLSK